MIRPAQIWLAVEPVDMRGGIDSLSQRTFTSFAAGSGP